MPHTSDRWSPRCSPILRGIAPSAEVALEMSDGFFCFLFAVLRPVALPAVVRVAMGYELYPNFAAEQTTIRANARAESYNRVIPSRSGVRKRNILRLVSSDGRKKEWLDLNDHRDHDGAAFDRLLHGSRC